MSIIPDDPTREQVIAIRDRLTAEAEALNERTAGTPDECDECWSFWLAGDSTIHHAPYTVQGMELLDEFDAHLDTHDGRSNA